MDPLSLASSLIAIVQISSKIVSICYEYRAVAKDARRDITSILDETVAIRTLVENLINLVERSDDDALLSLKAVNEGNAPLERCLQDLTDLRAVLKVEGGLRSRTVPLLWPLKQKEVKARLAALSRIKATLQLALGADTAANTVKILAHASSIPTIQNSLTNLSTLMEVVAQDEKKASLLAKIPSRNMALRHQEHCSKRVADTGEWMIKHKTYKHWQSRIGSLLWLCGAAGSGKTVLCSRIIDDLQSARAENQDVAILYFYIDGSDHQPLALDAFYSSFAYQLAQQLPVIPRQLTTHFRLYDEGEELEREWRKLYGGLMKEFSQIYIVIDALDECQEFIELDDMVNELTKLMDQHMQRTSIIVSSRPLEQLRRSFLDLGALQISMETDAANVDMETALRAQLSGNMPFKRWPQLLRNNIQDTLLAGAKGSFYWITCQLGSLKRCVTPAAVRECLRNLPTTLENHYVHELENLEANGGQSLRNVLRWVALSFRPLSTTELADAIAINLEDRDDPFIDDNLELFDLESFLDSCSSLLSTHRSVEDTHSDSTVFVRFAHFSVLEFLRSDALNEKARSKLTIEGGIVHAMLAKSCLVYIHRYAADEANDMTATRDFTQYAASSWLRHKQLSDDACWTSSSAEEMLYTVCDGASSSYQTWLEYTTIDRPWEHDNWTMRSWDEATKSMKTTKSRPYAKTTPLYAASYAGLSNVVTRLLASGADPNVKCGIHAFALQAAAAQGHVSIVKHLIAAGADLDADGGRSGFAIAAASTDGHTEIVRILLEAGAKTQPKGPGRGFGDRSNDPLFIAVQGGHLDIANLLLDHGARDWHEMKGRPCTALSAAIQSSRIDIVRAMLKHEHIHSTNTHVMSQIIRSQSSGMYQGLFCAASQGQKEMIRELADELTDTEKLRYAARAGDEELLSDAMASLSSFDEDGSSSDHPRALQSAAQGGHLAIVQKLLAAGVDPNRKQNWSTPLQESIRGANLEVAKALIEAGARVDGGSLGTAMHAGRRDFVELFVAHGANTTGCLRSAVYSGDFREFNILLELGADIHARELESHDARDSEISLLQAAAFGSSTRILQYLLDHGYGLDDVTQTHPLTEAIRCGHWIAARFLLDRGADVNAPPTSNEDPGSWGGVVIHGNCWPPRAACDTPLSAACKTSDRSSFYDNKAERISVAHQLLDMGALADPQLPGARGTPLIYAVWEEEVEIVRRLLERGASPNRPGTILRRIKVSYPLHIAAEKGNNEILVMLLEAGAVVNQQDSEGFSATHVAAGCPTIDCLRTLVRDYNANISVCLQNGSQPIHSAASKGDAERVQVLINAGADIDAQNNTGRTPLHWAADAENCGVVELLLDVGADPTVMADDGGVTAWDLMCLAAQKPSYARRRDGIREEEHNESAEKVRGRLRQAMVVDEKHIK